MADSKELRDLVAASFEALDRYEEAQETLAEDGERPPAPGDVYVLEATREFDVEWAVLAHDPADASRFLVVPADGHALAGSADVELADDSPAGALKLRCRFGAWTDARLLLPELRVGVLRTEELVRARQRWLDVGDGEVTGDVLGMEVDDDPGYRDWIEDVLVPARCVLVEAQDAREEPGEEAAAEDRGEPAVRYRRRPPGSTIFRIAAAIVLAVAGLQLWRLNQRFEDLETSLRAAEERHGVAIRQVETERDQLAVERDRLQERQQDLEAAGAENAAEVKGLRERVAALGRRLVEAIELSEVVNPAIAYFSPPVERQRGKVELNLRPEQSYVVLFLELREPSPAPRYRLEVRVRGEDPIWSNDRLVVQKPGEIRAGLPARYLRPGEYEVELLALEDDAFRRVAEYELVVIENPAPP